MTYNIAICDDNPVDLKAESELIKQCFNAKKLSYNINLFNNSKDLVNSDIKYDIIFLDIEMKDMNGIEAAELIHLKNKKCLMFFVTNYESYMDSAMDEHAFRFWEKPINKDRLMYGIESAIRKIRSYNACLTVSVNRQKMSIPITKIIFMVAENKKTRIITTDDEFVINEPLKAIKSRITSYSFCESHASYYINLNYVKDYTHTGVTCVYKNKEYTAYMSRRKYAEFNKHFIEWMGDQI
ncbi:MAG: LytTR family DNA-binding domain-containing protein [Clostridia bacterium]|nr:LytTR family DNA-binding domain-containing protein [Clostridia bacterium]